MEYANGTEGRVHPSFPAHWGVPPGDAYSEERHAWIVRNVANAPRRARSAAAAMEKANELAVANSRDARLNLVRALALTYPAASTLDGRTALAKVLELKKRT